MIFNHDKERWKLARYKNFFLDLSFSLSPLRHMSHHHGHACQSWKSLINVMKANIFFLLSILHDRDAFSSIFHYFISGRFPIWTKRSIHQTRTIGWGVLRHCFQRIQQVSFLKQEKLLGGEIFLRNASHTWEKVMSVFLLSLKECRTESKHFTNTDIYRLFA